MNSGRVSRRPTVPTAGAATGRFFADVGAKRPADSYLRSVHDPGESFGLGLHPRRVRRQRHSRGPNRSGRAAGAPVFPAAQSARRSGDGCAELFCDRIGRAQCRQRRRARRSPAVRQPEDVRALFVSEDVQRAGDLLSGGHRHRRGTGQRAEPRAQFRHRLQPDDLEYDGHERAYRLRPYVVPLRQPGPWLQAIEPRPAGVDRRQRRPPDVSALRRRRPGDARRQRSPLQRVHELHGGGEPYQGARRPHDEGRVRGSHAAGERVGGAQRRDVQLQERRDARAGSPRPPAAPPGTHSHHSSSARANPTTS